MLDELADLLLGARCPGCSRPGLGVCNACRAEVATAPFVVDDASSSDGLVVVAAGRHHGALRELITAHKDRDGLMLTGLLASRVVLAMGFLFEVVDAPARRRLVLVPVPSSPAAVRRRGFDHGWALARSASRQARRRSATGVSACRSDGVSARKVLRRVRPVADQSSLGRSERLHNQRGSMHSRPPRPGEVAVIVDDICTTGASLAEAHRALRQAGWTVLGAVVVAHPTRRHELSSQHS